MIIFNNFSFVEMDGKIIYNLQTGEDSPAFGEYKSRVEIAGNNYALLPTQKNLYLLISKKMIPLYYPIDI